MLLLQLKQLISQKDESLNKLKRNTLHKEFIELQRQR